eukprot:TRINITY_DN739_c0_g1_i1.p1 TRINITY_DN739_c0_g1~~TRINITY_DN739_c0_g1_i1.p1  ORF type:complete len:372 (-),score=84.56 TRINITY_DN739_c0_g1_i1:23-1138(-)
MSFNKFGFHLFLKSTKLGSENFAMSPLSIALAMSVCTNGARGETQREILAALSSDGSVDALNRFNRELQLSIAQSLPRGDRLDIANTVLMKPAYGAVDPSFAMLLKDFYNGQVFPLSEDVKEQVNRWVSQATNNMIPKLMESDMPEIEAAILNAIYFKGSWEKAFDKSDTEMAYFTPTCDTNFVQVPMMVKQTKMTYYETEKFRAVDLPYKAASSAPRLVATFLLPSEGLKLQDAVPHAFSTWENWTQSGAHNTTVRLAVPKFKIEGGADLSDAMKSYGIQEAFTPRADLSGFSQNSKGLQVSAILHKAIVEINEEGTTAAAATAVLMTRSFVRPVVVPLTFDRPFLFFVRDLETGSVIFMVQIYDPTLLQ